MEEKEVEWGFEHGGQDFALDVEEFVGLGGVGRKMEYKAKGQT